MANLAKNVFFIQFWPLFGRKTTHFHIGIKNWDTRVGPLDRQGFT